MWMTLKHFDSSKYPLGRMVCYVLTWRLYVVSYLILVILLVYLYFSCISDEEIKDSRNLADFLGSYQRSFGLFMTEEGAPSSKASWLQKWNEIHYSFLPPPSTQEMHNEEMIVFTFMKKKRKNLNSNHLLELGRINAWLGNTGAGKRSLSRIRLLDSKPELPCTGCLSLHEWFSFRPTFLHLGTITDSVLGC